MIGVASAAIIAAAMIGGVFGYFVGRHDGRQQQAFDESRRRQERRLQRARAMYGGEHPGRLRAVPGGDRR